MEQNLPFDLNTLLVFSKVVECRSLSRAATLLGLPKSTISRKITRLESDLGLKLLRRSTHQITVTDTGEGIYRQALKILAATNDIHALVESCKQEPQGTLRAAIPVFIGIDYASRVGTSFLQRNPKSQLEIRMVDKAVHPIKDGYDVAFGIGPLQDSTLIARKVFTLECMLCASAQFIEALPKPITVPAQLTDLPLIDADFYAGRQKLLLTNGRKRYELSFSARARANSFQISRQYVKQGLGIGILPKLMVWPDDIRAGALVPVLPDWTPEAVDVYMIYPFQLSYSNLISAFYDAALDIIGQNTRAFMQKNVAV